MSANFNSYGMSQTYVNGKKISDIAYDATYDGKHADIATTNGNIKTFMRLSNNDIENLLNNNSHSKTALHEKILNHSKSRRHKRRTKTPKSKRTPSRKKTRNRSKTITRSKKSKRSKSTRKNTRKNKRVSFKDNIDKEVIW